MEEKKLLRRRNKALNENNESVLINVCTDLANLYVEEGRYDFAIEEYTTVAKIYQKENKQLEYAIVNRGIGEAYLGLHKFDKALHHQKIYLVTVKELKNKLEEQRALATIGHTYLSSYLDSPEPDKKNLNSAKQFFMKSLVVSQSLHGEASKLEIADMSARLYCNLGLIQESLGDFHKASELINKSINLCKVHDLYEQLQRGYVSLAALLAKRGDHKSALQQYNLAAEAAKKIRGKPGLLAGVLLSKSEVLVKLGDLRGAKSALHKAYKLKISDTNDRRTIETNLRVVASMSNNENKLLVTEDTDYVTLKKLYEKMGDAACELKLFEKALDYYKKMLDAAVKAELTGSDLATCYYSLAETFKDNGQFDEAVTYFEKELALCKNLKDTLNTLSKIADTKEAGDAPVPDVRAVYDRAINSCKNENNAHEEGRMVKRCIAYLRRQKQHSEAFQMENTLAKLDYHSSDSESEGSETPVGSVVGGDIDLEAITDVSDDSDPEQPATKVRRRAKNFQIRRNLKGETQLHTACIKGQLNVVSHLLEQGHPVNVRDNCGWLPLHEACIHGHVEVVQALLDKGAAINDRGGTQCEGVTPLHDAASNGHLPIVQLLLSRGANAVAKTDDGDTVLHFLQKWRSGCQLDQDSEKLYDAIVEQISQSLEKAGHAPPEVVEAATPTKRSSALISPDEASPPRRSISENMRRSASIGLENAESRSPPSTSSRRSASFGLEDDGVGDYRDVIEGLRRRHEPKPPPKPKPVAKRSALLSSEEMVDDWLEDDVGKSVKKRRTTSPEPSVSPVKSQRASPPRRPRQTKLTNFGHTRTLVEADSTSSPSSTSFSRTGSFDSFQPVMDPTLAVDVRINKKLYRVPILLSQINNRTIKWLADEAAARYARKEYMIPTLELETKNGAILADDDPLGLLFPMGTSQAEEVDARVVKWSVPPLTDRFKEACHDMSVPANDKICQILQEMSVSLDLSYQGLKGTWLVPLCKVLGRQINLLELDFSGNFLTNECFQLLGSSMALLENLNRLGLACTGLQSQHVQALVNNLSPDVSYKLTDLDLSDNLLRDQCFESLAELTRRFQLKRLNLSGNKFTKGLFGHSFNRQLTLHLDQIEDFDLSDNELSNEALIRILSWLRFPNLKSLNLSRTSASEGFLREVLQMWTEVGCLRVCKLSRCHVHDADLFNLMRIANSLEVLDVSYNDDLTSISLRRLLEADITTLNLYGCRNILQYFTDFSRYLDESARAKAKTLKLSLPENSDNETGYLTKMWRDLYGNKTVVELTSRFLHLSVLK